MKSTIEIPTAYLNVDHADEFSHYTSTGGTVTVKRGRTWDETYERACAAAEKLGRRNRMSTTVDWNGFEDLMLAEEDEAKSLTYRPALPPATRKPRGMVGKTVEEYEHYYYG